MSTLGPALIEHALKEGKAAEEAAANAAVKTFILDTLGVGMAGARAPLRDSVAGAVQSGSTNQGRAHIWGGGGGMATPARAAFINAFQIHCQEFDCVHEGAVVHPMAVVMGALMAECDSRGKVSGTALMEAVLRAVDVAAGLGVAATTPLKFFRPATAGLFGATLGLARLRGFSQEEASHALGIALGFTSGTMQAHQEGAPTLPLQIGHAAQSALLAADLAEAGIAGPNDSLEGAYGYFALFEDGYEPARLLGDLGKTARITEVSHKPYPTGRAAHGGLSLIADLHKQGLSTESLESLTLQAPPLIARLVGRPARADMPASYARLCFAYLGARMIISGHVSLDDFTEAALGDPQTLRLAQRISVQEVPGNDPAAFTPQTLTATLRDRSKVQASTSTLYGSPADPLSRQAHLAKFRACVAFGFGTARAGLTEHLIETVDTLESVEDASLLNRLAAGKEG